MTAMSNLVERLRARIMARSPDVIIGGHERPYLLRWFVIPRNPIFNIYLHRFLRDDDDRALHDHPWFNLSILLQGRYVEHRIAAGGVHVQTQRRAGDVAARSPWCAHRIALIDGQPCLSLFITGPRIRPWGFHCRQGWVHSRDFTDPADSGRVGPGCGDLS